MEPDSKKLLIESVVGRFAPLVSPSARMSQRLQDDNGSSWLTNYEPRERGIGFDLDAILEPPRSQERDVFRCDDGSRCVRECIENLRVG